MKKMQKFIYVLIFIIVSIYLYYSYMMYKYLKLADFLEENGTTTDLLNDYVNMKLNQWYIYKILFVILIITLIVIIIYHFAVSKSNKDIFLIVFIFAMFLTIYFIKLLICHYVEANEEIVLKNYLQVIGISFVPFLIEFIYNKTKNRVKNDYS